MIDKFSNYPIENIKWILDMLQEDEVFSMKSCEELIDNQYGALKLFKDLNVKSGIAVNICDSNKNSIGFLGINTAIEEKLWHDEEIGLLRNSAAIFFKALSLINKY